MVVVDPWARGCSEVVDTDECLRARVLYAEAVLDAEAARAAAIASAESSATFFSFVEAGVAEAPSEAMLGSAGLGISGVVITAALGCSSPVVGASVL